MGVEYELAALHAGAKRAGCYWTDRQSGEGEGGRITANEHVIHKIPMNSKFY